MKYFKFTQIDAETGISWAIKQPISGPSWPNIPGLNVATAIQLAHSPIYYISKVDVDALNAQLLSDWQAKVDAQQPTEDNPNPESIPQPDPIVIVADPDNHFFELTLEEYANELKDHVMVQLNKEKNTIYQQEADFRNNIFTPYHDTATIAGVYKYNQAKELVADETAAAPDVRAEATARGVTPVVMANRIIQNHENFRAKEAKIAGIRGKIQDRINAFSFDMQDPEASLAEFRAEETIGTTKGMGFENGEMVEKDIDVKIHKYSLSLSTRFQYE